MPDQALFLKNIERAIGEFGLISLKSRFEVARELLNQPALVDVAVFGRFKAGKSSFINDLVGKTVLPVGVIPVTAVITRIRFGPEERIKIRFLDGTENRVALDTLSDYISESKNPENEKKIDSVDIEVPTLKSFEGLQFVDTPGLGSVFKHNSETSLNWLPQVGVALVAVSVDPPLSEYDISLIKELKRFTPKIMILLTKGDLVTNSQLAQIQEFIQKQLAKNIGTGDFQIWPYSIHDEFRDYKEKLQTELLQPLAKRRDQELQHIAEHKLEVIKSECIRLLSVALKASKLADDERGHLKSKVLGEKSQGGVVPDEFQMLAREYSGRTRPFIMEELKKSQITLEEALSNDLKNEMSNWHGRLWDFSRKFEEWLRFSFNRELSAISINQTGTFLKPLNDAHGALVRSVRAFQGRLSTQVKEALGIELQPAEFNLDVKIPGQPDISFGRIFDTPFDLLSFAIPMTVFRGIIERHFLKSIPYEVEKNLSRLGSQWTEDINKSILRMANDAQSFVNGQLDQIQRLLEASLSSTGSIEKAVKNLSYNKF